MKKFKNSFVYAGILAFVLNLVLETLGRFTTGDWLSGIRFMFTDPLVFMYNMLLINMTLVIASLFSRRVFVFVIVSVVWLAIGIANGVILTQRMTPFTVKDFAMIGDGLTIVNNYLEVWQMVLIGIGVLILLGLLALLYIRGPQKKEGLKRKRNLAGVILVVMFTFLSTTVATGTGLLDTFFGNLAYAYKDNGVAYCFVNTGLNTGISKPGGYSEEKVLGFFNEDELGSDNIMNLEVRDVDEEYPNLLFLQLESFIDPLTINTIELSEDPCPNFRRLYGEFSSGELTVPACGAGTANVEFEVLTGLSARFFGPGEYPYKSILTEKTVENLAYDLKSMGYSAHAIHNHRAVFYNRNTVFANMGFDTFTSVEYMKNVLKNEKNWAKDGVLVDCINDALNSTDSRDLIYTISVQGHGKYPEEEILEDPEIRVTEAPTEELKWKFEYYVNQIYEMDQFIGELTAELAKREEPVVLVMYGDHIPAIEFEEADLASGNLYGTQYIIWDNMGTLNKTDGSLHAYELAAYVMEKVDMQVGTIFTYQQNHGESSTFLEDLKTLGYDMLYGRNYIYGEQNPFRPSDLKMGINDIIIEEVVQLGERYYIKGQNFTPYSFVTVDGETLETIFLGETMLGLMEYVEPEKAADMKVSQVDKNSKEILSITE